MNFDCRDSIPLKINTQAHLHCESILLPKVGGVGDVSHAAEGVALVRRGLGALLRGGGGGADGPRASVDGREVLRVRRGKRVLGVDVADLGDDTIPDRPEVRAVVAGEAAQVTRGRLVAAAVIGQCADLGARLCRGVLVWS